MLETRIVRELVVDDAAGIAGQTYLSAASGLVKLGTRLFVVADDEHHLAMFDLSNREPGRLVAIFDGELPLRHKARKAAKRFASGDAGLVRVDAENLGQFLGVPKFHHDRRT